MRLSDFPAARGPQWEAFPDKNRIAAPAGGLDGIVSALAAFLEVPLEAA